MIDQVPTLTYSVQDAMAVVTPFLLYASLLVGFSRARRDSHGAGAVSMRRVSLVTLTFGTLHVLAAAVPGLLGFYGRDPIGGTVYIAVVIAVVLVVTTVTARSSASFRAGWLHIPHAWLIGAHALRVIPGIVFLATYEMGLVPGANAIPAGYGDIAAGLLAVPVALALAARRPGAHRAAVAWNIFGLADLFWAVGSGMVLIPTRALEIMETQGQAVHLNHLYVLPAAPVVLWVAMHVLLIWSLSTRRYREAR